MMQFQQAFDSTVEKQMGQFPSMAIDALNAKFAKEHVVMLKGLLSTEVQAEFAAEARQLLQSYGQRKDVRMRVTGNTPRNYQTVSRDDILHSGRLIPAFYHSEVIRGFLTEITGSPMHTVPYAPEEYIVNCQQAVGDTHGWHWDDYTYALVWLVDSPQMGQGGLIEYVQGIKWDKTNVAECVNNVLRANTPQQLYVPTGSCYLLKADTTMHRITPLLENALRTVVVFTFASEADLQKPIAHETMEELYHSGSAD